MELVQGNLKDRVTRLDPYHGSKILKMNLQLKPKEYRQNATSTAPVLTLSKQLKHKSFKIGCLFKGTILLLLLNPKSILACYGYGSVDTDYWVPQPKKKTPPVAGVVVDNDEEHENLTGVTNIVDRNKKSSWGGWTPPPEVENDWKIWLNEFEVKNNGTNYMDEQKKVQNKNEREKGGDWPVNWADLGEGHGGAAPPPWAYMHRNTGKPEYCAKPPAAGKCKKRITRYGYNPYLEKCMSFIWSGCGGNDNNFMTELKCEEACVVPPDPGCDTDSHIYVDDLIIS